MLRNTPRLGAAFLLLSSALLVGALSPRSVATSPSIPAQFTVTVRSHYSYYVVIDAYSPSGRVSYNVTSDTPVSVALMDSSQFNHFNSTGSGLQFSVICQNGTSAYQVEDVPDGPYYLVIYAYGARAHVNIGYFIYPNTPYSYYGPTIPTEATGIASYGITNSSGTITPYEVQASSIVGLANISSILADNPDAERYGSNVAGATLQLNTYLVVNDSGGEQQAYWIQNTPDFSTSLNLVSIGEDLWNFTTENSYFTNKTVTSTNPESGVFSGSVDYYLAEDNTSYALPFNFALIENASVESGVGVLVRMGIDVLANGTTIGNPRVNWFDSITFHDPSALKSYFDVNGNQTPLAGGSYDSELVFAGEGNGEPTTFTKLDSALGLFYQRAAGGVLYSFPSYYGFGVSTAESTYNLAVTYSNGIANVSPGTPDYGYLGPSSITYTLPGTSMSSTSTTSTTMSSTTATQASTSQSSVTSTATTRTAATTTSGSATSTGGVPEFPYQATIVSFLVVALAISYLSVRRRTR